MKRKLPEKFFEQNQRAKTRKWKFFNLNQALWGAGNREFRSRGTEDWRLTADTNVFSNPNRPIRSRSSSVSQTFRHWMINADSSPN